MDIVKTREPTDIPPLEEEGGQGKRYAVAYVKAPHRGNPDDKNRKDLNGRVFDMHEPRPIEPGIRPLPIFFPLFKPFNPASDPIPDDCVAAIVTLMKDGEDPELVELIYFNDGDRLTYTDDPLRLVRPDKANERFVSLGQDPYAFSGRPFVKRGDTHAQIVFPEDEADYDDEEMALKMAEIPLRIFDASKNPRVEFNLDDHDLGEHLQESHRPGNTGFEDGPIGVG